VSFILSYSSRPANRGEKEQTLRIPATALIVGILSQGVIASFPAPAGRVNDFAGVLDAAARTQVETIVREAERITSAEIAVATVSSLDGMSVEEYANKLFHFWGIGKKDRDNGVLVLVAPNERKVRIEVGYGLEPILPDGLAGEIIRTEILPRFRENDYSGGTLAAITRIAGIVQRGHVLTAEERRQLDQASSNDQPPMIIMIPFFGIFVSIGAFMVGAGLKSKTVFPLMFGGFFGGLPFLMSLIPFFNAPPLILASIAILMGVLGYRKSKPENWRQAAASSSGGDTGGWAMGTSASSSSDSSSSGSSGSDFGGGDSGGGGASGSW
jgi:uncharacterized protein